MSGVLIIYIPAQWDTSVETVLREAGFQVKVGDRTYNSGPGHEYQCQREGSRVSFSVAPIPGDSEHLAAMGSALPEHVKTLFLARDALMQQGALDEKAYKEHRRRQG